MNKPLNETLKFVARMAVFALPLIVAWLTKSGWVEWAGVASALLAAIDKFIHESPDTKATGLVPF